MFGKNHLKILFPVLLFILMYRVGSNAECLAATAPGIEWQITLAGKQQAKGTAVQWTGDGGYLIAGETYSNPGLAEVYLIKVNSSGIVEWENYLGDGQHDYHPVSLIKASDGGYFIAGCTYIEGHDQDVFIIKTDSSGNLVWRKFLGDAEAETACDARLTVDGGLLITGQYKNADALAIKTDPAGNLSWFRVYGDLSVESACSGVQAADGGFLIVGYHNLNDLYYLKLDYNGIKQWATILPGRGQAKYVVATSDKSFAITGQNGSADAFFMKINSSANILIDQSYGNSFIDCGLELQQTSDGGYIISGCTQPAANAPWNLYLVKTDSSGIMEWDKAAGENDNEMAESIKPTSDGGYITAGSRWAPGGCKILVVKYGEQPEDTIPPITTVELSGTRGANGWYTTDVMATISVSDGENGSGINKTEYSYDGLKWYVYSEPLALEKEGVVELCFRSTDNAGNIEAYKTEIVKMDKTPPIISLAGGITVEATGANTVINLVLPTAEDISKVSFASDAPLDFRLGSTLVNWTATDEAGNKSDLSQVVTIVDTTKPVISVPGEIWVDAAGPKTAVNIGQATANDIFPVTITNDAPVDYQVGMTSVTWKAADSNGNIITAVQKIIILDNVPPVLNIPADATIEATGIQTMAAVGQATATDYAPVVISNDAPPNGFPLGSTVVTWTAEDTSGNKTIGTQRVTVIDTTRPELTVPGDMEVLAADKRTVVNIGQATASDFFPVSISSDAPPDFPLGSTAVTWNAVDASGNFSSAVQTITVVKHDKEKDKDKDKDKDK